MIEQKQNSRRLTIADDTEQLYWIAQSPEKHNVVHYGSIGQEQEVNTGQDQLSEYESEEDWLLALEKLGITPDQEPRS